MRRQRGDYSADWRRYKRLAVVANLASRPLLGRSLPSLGGQGLPARGLHLGELVRLLRLLLDRRDLDRRLREDLSAGSNHRFLSKRKLTARIRERAALILVQHDLV